MIQSRSTSRQACTPAIAAVVLLVLAAGDVFAEKCESEKAKEAGKLAAAKLVAQTTSDLEECYDLGVPACGGVDDFGHIDCPYIP